MHSGTRRDEHYAEVSIGVADDVGPMSLTDSFLFETSSIMSKFIFTYAQKANDWTIVWESLKRR